ncbi:MAG: DUF4192 domain-containing protein [Nostocoides sp.]
MDIHPIRRPDELLAILPFHLGYHPDQSLVLVGLSDLRIQIIQRFDLFPAIADSSRAASRDVIEDHVLSGLRVLVQSGVDLVIPVLYENEPGEADGLLAIVLGSLARIHMPLVDPVWVQGGRWGLVFDDESDGFQYSADPEAVMLNGPRRAGPSYPMTDPSRVAAVADFVGMGFAPAASRADLADLVTPTPGDERTLVVERSLRIRCARRGPSPIPRSATLAAWGRFLTSVCDPATSEATMLRGSVATSRDAAAMASSLTHILWRDAVMAWLCPGTLPLARLPDEIVDRVQRLPRPTGMSRPTDDSVAAVRRLEVGLQCLCQVLPEQPSAPTAAMLSLTALVSWWRGDGTMARICLDRALAVDPEYSLAQIITQMVEAGMRPPEIGPPAALADGTEEFGFDASA